MNLNARRRSGYQAAAIVAAAVLLAGCGSGGGADGMPTARPVGTLKARHVKAALPDKEALPGWRQIGSRQIDTHGYLCQVVAGDACNDVIATGTANFTRGAQRTTKWLRFSFTVYSCRTVSAAQLLYEAMPDYDKRADGAKTPALGDESAASSSLLNGEHPVSIYHDKVRIGTTVLWTFAMGTEEAVTSERAELAAKLQVERVQQAHLGLKPSAHADVP
ncbi:hypothetical protein EOT10_25755 [Streptomyces antnestii]|uniref:DUF3558 domain-containing protein n=1 Tax=Streptomyces antnestii TaxID=2494256 RepID=A0A3S2VZI5_9ACTN|nr:hypothetical protein [Streptomyces sp. San01]RVU21426.1 hypothetical protein EOT10_25755 [Streptomyces sp. San01]